MGSTVPLYDSCWNSYWPSSELEQPSYNLRSSHSAHPDIESTCWNSWAVHTPTVTRWRSIVSCNGYPESLPSSSGGYVPRCSRQPLSGIAHVSTKYSLSKLTMCQYSLGSDYVSNSCSVIYCYLYNNIYRHLPVMWYWVPVHSPSVLRQCARFIRDCTRILMWHWRWNLRHTKLILGDSYILFYFKWGCPTPSKWRMRIINEWCMLST